MRKSNSREAKYGTNPKEEKSLKSKKKKKKVVRDTSPSEIGLFELPKQDLLILSKEQIFE